MASVLEFVPNHLTTMKTFLGASLLARALIIATLLIPSKLPLLAQSETNDLGGLEIPLVDPPPQHGGTFWLLSGYYFDTNGFIHFSRPPTPCIPLATEGLPVYYLTPDTNFGIFSTNSYVIDDSSILTEQGEWQMASEEGSGGDGGDSGGTPAYSYPSNYLYLIIDAVSNSTAYIRAIGTVPDQIYELLSREQLLDTNGLTVTNWTSEGTFIGAGNQDWTPTTVAVGTRTNSLFLSCRSWADDDGDGLPSWWEMQYGLDPYNPDTGNTGIPDGYKNPADDGWNNIYKYEHGMNPGQFYTPPPPRNVQARLDSTGTNVVVTWASGGGSVAQYQVVRFFGIADTNTVAASTLSFTDDVGVNYLADPLSDPAYMVIAIFSNGAASASPLIVVERTEFNRDLRIVRGPTGGRYLTMQSPPAGLSKLRLYWAPPFPNPGDPQYPYFEIEATNIVNGVVPLPFDQLNRYPLNYTPGVRAICTNGFSQFSWFLQNEFAPEEGVRDYGATNFVNAAVQMKENLKFLLRSANVRESFSYASGFHVPTYDDPRPDPALYAVNDPEYGYERPPLATNYEYYGFHTYSPNLGYAFLEEGRPLRDNFFWRNFAFNTVDITNGTFNTGTGIGYSVDLNEFVRGLANPKYVYWGSGTESPLPIVLTNSGFTWSYWLSASPDETDLLADAGMYVDAGTNLFLPNAVSNIFGLRINSVHFKNNNNQYVTLNRGGSIPAPDGADFFVETEVPILQPVDYYFASQQRYIWYGSPLVPVPGSPDFSTTNSLPIRITGIGQPITVAGWAKMAITNGYPGTYAYLEQYWDKAYTVGTNGLPTANQTGLLSPYGEFFPTEPGETALVTMPDIDSGQRGASLVHVIKVQLDVNHDGDMDLTFGGPDNTSQDRPFVFWVNDDYDRLNNDSVGDDFASTDRKANSPYTFKSAPDCEYRNSQGDRIIPSVRDLEDFARLWFAGLSTNMYNSLPADITAELSWGDKGNPNPNNPTIDIFATVDNFGQPNSGSGIGYLTNYLTAQHQATNALTGTRLGPGDSISVVFSNSVGYQGWNRAI
jgi:hypothetical protein